MEDDLMNILQTFLDNAFNVNFDWRTFFNYKWKKSEEFEYGDNDELNALYDVFQRKVESKYIEKWFMNPDTNLAILEYIFRTEFWEVIKYHRTEFFYQKDPTGMTYECFTNICTKISFPDDPTVLYSWYAPFCNEGWLHFWKLKQDEYEEYLKLSQMYSFDPKLAIRNKKNYPISKMKEEECRKLLHTYEYDREQDALDMFGPPRVTYLFRGLNSMELTLSERVLFVKIAREYCRSSTEITKYMIQDLVVNDDMFEELKEDIKQMVEKNTYKRNLLGYIARYLNGATYVKWIDFFIELVPKHEHYFKFQIILHSGLDIVEAYFGEITQDIIDDIVKGLI